jgi:hypothetical protein
MADKYKYTVYIIFGFSIFWSSIPEEGYYRNKLCALTKLGIYIFDYLNYNIKLDHLSSKRNYYDIISIILKY